MPSLPPPGRLSSIPDTLPGMNPSGTGRAPADYAPSSSPIPDTLPGMNMAALPGTRMDTPEASNDAWDAIARNNMGLLGWVYEGIRGRLSDDPTDDLSHEQAISRMADIGADIGLSAGSGVASVGEMIGTGVGIATGQYKNPIREESAALREYLAGLRSDDYKAREQARAAHVAATDGGWWNKAAVAFWDTVSDPVLLSGFAAEQAPNMMVSGGTGAATSALARWAGWGAKNAGRLGTAAGVGTGSAMTVADAASGAFDELLDLPDALWEVAPGMKELEAAGVPFEEAKLQIATNLANTAGLKAGAVSLATNILPWARLVERRFAGVPGAGGKLLRAGKAVVGESFQEGTEEGYTAYASGEAVQNVDPLRDPMRDVGESVGLGVVLGGSGVLAGTGASVDDVRRVLRSDLLRVPEQVWSQHPDVQAAKAAGKPILPVIQSVTAKVVKTAGFGDTALSLLRQELGGKIDPYGQEDSDLVGPAARRLFDDLLEIDPRMWAQHPDVRAQTDAGTDLTIAILGTAGRLATQSNPDADAMDLFRKGMGGRRIDPVGAEGAIQRDMSGPAMSIIGAQSLDEAIQQADDATKADPRNDPLAPDPAVRRGAVRAGIRRAGQAVADALRGNVPGMVDAAKRLYAEHGAEAVDHWRAEVRARLDALNARRKNRSQNLEGADADEQLTPEEAAIQRAKVDAARMALGAKKAVIDASRASLQTDAERAAYDAELTRIQAETSADGNVENEALPEGQAPATPAPLAPGGARPAASMPTIPTSGDLDFEAQSSKPIPLAAVPVTSTGQLSTDGGDVVYTPTGATVGVQYAVVELADLIPSHDAATFAVNPSYPQSRQPRDRRNVAYQGQVANLVSTFTPARLGFSTETSNGSPIIDRAGIVESGNGRVMALSRIYADGNSDKAQAYRAQVAQWAGAHVDLSGFRQPVFVRVRTQAMTDAEIQQYTQDSNAPVGAQLQTTERALADAGNLSAELLRLFVPEAPLTSPQNDAFVRGFVGQVLTPNDTSVMTADGTLSQDGRRRIEAALLARAYGAPDVVEALAADTESSFAGIGKALLDAAPAWARMRDLVALGQSDAAMDITPQLLAAVRLVRQSRERGRALSDLTRQLDLTGRPPLDETGMGLLGLMFRDHEKWTRPTGRKPLGEALRVYAQSAQMAAPGGDLLGMAPTPSDLLAQVSAQAGITGDDNEETGAAGPTDATDATDAAPAEQPVSGTGGGNATSGERGAEQGAEGEAAGGRTEPVEGRQPEPQPEARGDEGSEESGESFLTRTFGDAETVAALQDEIDARFGDIADLTGMKRVIADVLGIEPGAVAPPMVKGAEELYEVALVGRARAIATAPGLTDDMVWQSLLSLYMGQPNLGARTTDSMARQAYSTPVPLSWIAAKLAGVGAETSVYEPTAGNGSLLILSPPGPVFTNELDADRRAGLRHLGYNPTAADAADATTGPEAGTVDAVLANPPFGKLSADGSVSSVTVDGYKLGAIDHLIAARALTKLKDDGRAVLLLGADGRTETQQSPNSGVFLAWLGNHYNVTGHFEIDGKLYSRQGAGWPIRVLVIDGRKAQPTEDNRPVAAVESRLTTWAEVHDEYQRLVDAGTRRGGSGAPAGTQGGNAAGGQKRPGAAGGGADNGPREDSAAGGQGAAGGRGPDSRTGGGARGGRRGAGAGGDAAGTGGANRPDGGTRGGRGTGPDVGSGGTDRNPDAGNADAGGLGGGAGGTDGLTPTLPDYGSQNTLISKDQAAELRKRLLEKLRPGQVNTGFDPELFGIGVQLTAYHVEAGARQFLAYVRAMRADLGLSTADLRPYLQSWYNGARNLLESNGRETSGMDGAEIVAALHADIANLVPDTGEQPGPGGDQQSDRVNGPGQADTAGQGDQAGGSAPEGAPAPGANDTGTAKPVGDDLQTPYISAAYGTDEKALIPSNLADPTLRALERLKAEVGDLADYVAGKLGLRRDQAFQQAFMGLQLDAVAMSIYQAERGSAVVIADQTGIGKGRQAAAMIRYGMLHGYTPIFVTEKPNLFTDMWGDLRDIGVPDSEIRPFVMNHNAPIKPDGEGGRVLRNPSSRKEYEALIASVGANSDAPLPGRANMLFTTYSQFDNGEGIQRPALARLVSVGNPLFVLDEAHNASGERSSKVKVKDKETGQEVWEERVSRAGYVFEVIDGRPVTYLSATFAKRPDNLPIYYRTDISEAVDTVEDLADAVAAGGVPLQSVISAGLAESGQLMRRERSFEGISIPIEILPDTNGAQRAQHDAATEVLRALMYASASFKEDADALADYFGVVTADAAGNKLHTMTTNPFTNVVHNYVSQVALGIKADYIADQAIQAVRNGEKPMIVVEKTMESFLKEWVDDNDVKVGDSVQLSYRDVMRRAMNRSMRLKIKDMRGGEEIIQVTLDDLRAAAPGTATLYELADAAINSMNVDSLPSSPLDWIRHRMTEAGINVAEITGRTLMVDYSGDMTAGRLANRPSEEGDRRGSVDAFNGMHPSRKVDALIINAAGATGLSAHASERFKDQRPRRMIVAELMANVNTLVQALGRINRTGQVELPRYTVSALDLPSERRPLANAARKLKSLNANTTGSGTSATSIQGVDMFNLYGDLVVAQYLIDNPTLKIPGVTVDVSEDGTIGRNPELASKFFGKLAVFPVARQEAVYRVVEDAYNELLAFMDATGQNELDAATMDMRAGIMASVVLAKGKNPGSVFGGDALLHQIVADQTGKFLSADTVRAELAKVEGDMPAGPFLTGDAIGRELRAAQSRPSEGSLLTGDAIQRELDRTRGASSADAFRAKPAPVDTMATNLQRLADASVAYRRWLDERAEQLEQRSESGEGDDAIRRREVENARNAVDQFLEDMNTAAAALMKFGAGSRHKILLGDQMQAAVVLGVWPTEDIGMVLDDGRPLNPAMLSRWKAQIAVNGPAQILTLPLSRLRPTTYDQDGVPTGSPGIWVQSTTDLSDAWLDRAFDATRASEGIRVPAMRYMVTGNLLGGFAAMSQKGLRGRVTFFTDAAGNQQQGILLPLNFNQATMQALAGDEAQKVRDAEQAQRIMEAGFPLAMAKAGITVRMEAGARTGSVDIKIDLRSKNREHVEAAKAMLADGVLKTFLTARDFSQARRNQPWTGTVAAADAAAAMTHVLNTHGAVRVIGLVDKETREKLGMDTSTAAPASFDGTNPAPERPPVEKIETLDLVGDLFEDATPEARPRRPEGFAHKATVPVDAGSPRDVTPEAQSREMQPFEQVHGKTGEMLYMAQVAQRVPRDVYLELNRLAKIRRGRYSSWTGGGAKAGFEFKSASERDAFMAQANAVLAGVQFAQVEQGEVSNGMSHLGVQAAIAPILRRLDERLGLRVRVLHSSEIPGDVLDQVAVGRTPAAYTLRGGREIVLVHDNIRDARAARMYLAHEIFGHVGVNEIVGDQWPEIAAALKSLRSSPDKQARAIWEEVARRYPDAVNNDDDVTLAQEFIAVAAEVREASGPVARFMAMVREAVRGVLRALGFNQPMSLSDVNALLSASERLVRGSDAMPGLTVGNVHLRGYTAPLRVASRQTDMFGAPGAPGQRQAPVEAATGSDQGAVDDLKARPGKERATAMRLMQGVFVRNQEVGRVKIGTNKITSAADLIPATAHLVESAQEVAVAIVTDKAGKILEMQRHTIGGIAESQIFMVQLLGAALDVEGGAVLHMVHNHPSGGVEFSGADRVLQQTAKVLLADTGLEFGYFSTIARKGGQLGAAWINAMDDNTESQESGVASAVRPARGFTLPITERRFDVPRELAATNGALWPKVTSYDKAESYVADLVIKAKGSGVLLLDNGNRIVGVLRLDLASMSAVRSQGGKEQSTYAQVIRAAHATNARSVIVYGPKLRSDAVKNVIVMASQINRNSGAGLNVLDAVLWDNPDPESVRAMSMISHAGSTLSDWKQDQAYFALNDPDAKAQFAYIDRNKLDPEQQRALNKIGGGTQGTVRIPFATRFAMWIARPGVTARQYWADSYLSFRKVLGAERAWKLSHLSKSAGGAMEALMEYGQVYLDPVSGVLQVDTGKESLRAILTPLEDEMDRFLMWIAANRMERLMAEGRERLADPVDIAAMKRLNQDGKPGDAWYRPGRQQLYADTYQKFKAFHESIVQIAVDTGLVEDAEAKQWQQDGYYLPFYRELEETSGNAGPPMMANPSLVRQNAYKRLKGGEQMLRDLLENAMGNWHHLLQASLRNQAARAALEQAAILGMAAPTRAGTKGAIWVRVNGKPKWFELDDTPDAQLVLQSLVAFNTNDLNGAGWRLMKKAKRALTYGVTANPGFKAANLFRDTVTSAAVSALDLHLGRNIKEGWHATNPNDPIYPQLLASGAIFAESGFVYGGDPEVIRWLVNRGVRRNTILDTRMLLKRGLDKWSDLGTRLENVNRAARFVQGQARGESLLDSAFEARDLLDFTRTGAGYWARAAAATIGFINARIQGLDKLGRAGVDPAQRGQFALVAGTYIASSVGLYLIGAMSGDPEWEEAEDWEHYTYHLIPTPGEGVLRLPRAFELGAAATLAEGVLEQIIKGFQGKGDAELFKRRLFHVLTQTFDFTIIPQLLQPARDLIADEDSFTKRPIEGTLGERGFGRGLSPELRKRAYTSETAGYASQLLSGILWDEVTLSPVQIDHLVEGYFGWLGAMALKASDMALEPFSGAGEAPTKSWLKAPLVERFFRTGVPRSTKYVTAFYQIDAELERMANDQRFYDKNGAVRPDMAEAAARHAAENADDLAWLKSFRKSFRKLSEINQQQVMIRNDPSLTGDQKRDQIEMLDVERHDIARSVVMAYKDAQ